MSIDYLRDSNSILLLTSYMSMFLSALMPSEHSIGPVNDLNTRLQLRRYLRFDDLLHCCYCFLQFLYFIFYYSSCLHAYAHLHQQTHCKCLSQAYHRTYRIVVIAYWFWGVPTIDWWEEYSWRGECAMDCTEGSNLDFQRINLLLLVKETCW